MNQITKSLPVAALLLGLPLVACSSDDEDVVLPPPVPALELPPGVSIVAPDPTGVFVGPMGTPAGGSSFSASSDYNTDHATLRLYDPILESLDNVNVPLCEADYARATEFVNDRPYMAQVDSGICGETRAVTKGEGIDVLFRVSTFEVDRPSDSDPQDTDLWQPSSVGMTPVTVYGEIDVTSEPVALDPLGEFEVQFAGVESGSTVQMPLVYGALVTAAAEAGFRFLHEYGDVDVPAMNPGDVSQRVQAIVDADAMAGTGAAKITQIDRSNSGMGDSGQITTTTRLVYDADNVKRQTEMDPEVVFDRADYTNHVHSYGLYHNTGPNAGRRVSVNTGRGVRLQSGAYAWIDYHGYWKPSGESLNDGDTVTSLDGLSTYTVRRAPGRLYRATRGSISLMNLTDQRFEWVDMGQRYEIAYSGVEWQRVSTWNSMTESWDPVTPPTTINVSMEGGVLFMWSAALGNVSFEDGASSVLYYRSELVHGDDTIFTNGPSVDLFATYRGLRGEVTSMEASSGDVFLSTPNNISNAHKYTISNTDMTLYHDVNGDGSVMERVGFASMVEPSSGPNSWGMISGPLVLSTSLATMSSVLDVLDETTYYVYEAGHNPWNQYVGIYGPGNAYVQFEAPLQIRYTHSQMNDMNDDMSYDGLEMLLTYAGTGKLLGFPGGEVDVDGDTYRDRYFPKFSLKDGTLIGPADAYIVRALGVEQTLEIDMGGAPMLDLTNADPLVVPPLTIYTTPTSGSPPTVTSPPAVIDGDMQ